MLTKHGLEILRGRNRNQRCLIQPSHDLCRNLTSFLRLRSSHQVYAVSSTPANSKSLQTSLMARERPPYNSQSLHFQLLTSLHKLESSDMIITNWNCDSFYAESKRETVAKTRSCRSATDVTTEAVWDVVDVLRSFRRRSPLTGWQVLILKRAVRDV